MTPLYPQKLTLTSPTAGGRSVGMVRSRTKATEFSFIIIGGGGGGGGGGDDFVNFPEPIFCK